MDYQNIIFAVEDGIATITINRPKALNALNQATVSELKDVVEKIAADNYNQAAERNVQREQMKNDLKIARTNKNKYDKK